MNKSLKIGLVLSLGVLSANVALANDAVVGALLGGGAGVIVGNSVGGRDGALVGAAIGAAAGAALAAQGGHGGHGYGQTTRVHSTGYYAPVYGAPAYVAPRPYYAAPVYYSAPVRVAPPRVYYIDRGQRGHGRHPHDRDWDRRGHRDSDHRNGRR